MEQNYNFNRNDNTDPTGTNISMDISTSIRGDEPPFEAVMSGIESFLLLAALSLTGAALAASLVPNN
jgi:hypothetical protein